MDLNTLLQRAENLTNKSEPDVGLPRVNRTLKQVLQATTELHSRVTQTGGGAKDIQAHILLGAQGIDLPKLNQKLEALSTRKTFEPLDAIKTDTDVCTFLKSERENAILSVIEDTNKNISETVSKQKWAHLNSTWNEEKTRLLDALVAPSQNFVDLHRMPGHTNMSAFCQPDTSLNALELNFAKELRQYVELLLKGGQRPNLVQKFAQLSAGFGDTRLTDMWVLLACVTQVDEPQHSDPIKTRQQRPEFVSHARGYLERRYRTYMASMVGGSYATNSYQLVLAYVSSRFSAQQTIGLLDTVGGRPLWPLVYYGLRCGAPEVAVDFLREAGPSHEEFAQLIADRTGGGVNNRIESQLRLQYANKIRNSTDAYKKAVYCILLRCDVNEVHSEVAKTIDDFLWLKLAMLVPHDAAAYAKLQALILEKYGEKYFNARDQWHLYFTTLALTGQFEAAIEFLTRTESTLVHAVHMAIALHELGLLGGARSVSQPLLSIDAVDPQPLRRFNVARLVRQYTYRFERSDTAEAVHYYFMLRCLRDAKGRNMFVTCIYDLVVNSSVLDTDMFDLIFGKRQGEDDDNIMRGLLSQFDCPEFNTRSIAVEVADVLASRANFEMAVRLYELGDQYTLAFKHISIMMAQVMRLPTSEAFIRDHVCEEAQRLSQFLDNGSIEVDPKVKASFLLLLDLLVFFNLYDAKKYPAALEQVKRTQLVPLNVDEVAACLATVKRVNGEVTKVLPDVLVALMDITQTLYKQLRELTGSRDQLKLLQLQQQAKAISSLAASMPCRLPHNSNRRLLQLELMMN